MNWFKRHPIVTYICLAYGLTWLGWIPTLVLSTQAGYKLLLIGNYAYLWQHGFANAQHVALALGFSLAVYGPLLAAICVTWLEGGTDTVRSWWKRLFPSAAPHWYGNVVWLSMAVALAPMLLGAILGQVRLNATPLLSFLPFLLPAFLMQLLTSGLGEEPGWRGFLLPRLQAQLTGEKPIWWLGLAWAVWHYPFTLYTTLTQLTAMPPLAIGVTLLSALVGQTMTLIGITYLYVWLYNHTQSVGLAIFFHALTNTLLALPLGDVQPTVTLLTGLAPWAIVLILQNRLGKERFPGIPPAEAK